MKKSKQITLLFVSGILASCTPASEEKSLDGEKKVYMRSDSTAGYSPAHGFMTGLLLYHVFRPYGYAGANGFQRGYYNGALAPNSNIGRNAYKGNVVRGGMGNSDKSASS